MGTSGEADSGELWKMESLLSAGPRAAAAEAPGDAPGGPWRPRAPAQRRHSAQRAAEQRQASGQFQHGGGAPAADGGLTAAGPTLGFGRASPSGSRFRGAAQGRGQEPSSGPGAGRRNSWTVRGRSRTEPGAGVREAGESCEVSGSALGHRARLWASRVRPLGSEVQTVQTAHTLSPKPEFQSNTFCLK